MSRSKRPKCSAGRGCWICALADTRRKPKRVNDRVRAEIEEEAFMRFDWTAAAAYAESRLEVDQLIRALARLDA